MRSRAANRRDFGSHVIPFYLLHSVRCKNRLYYQSPVGGERGDGRNARGEAAPLRGRIPFILRDARYKPTDVVAYDVRIPPAAVREIRITRGNLLLFCAGSLRKELPRLVTRKCVTCWVVIRTNALPCILQQRIIIVYIYICIYILIVSTKRLSGVLRYHLGLVT